jgi:hypothetical protein
MRKLLSLTLVFAAWLAFVACAQGTGDGIGQHPDAHVGGSGHPDANFNQPADAPPFSTPDAFVATPDAFVATPDGATGGTCSTSAECAAVNPLTCCSGNACVVGVDFGPPIGCVKVN